RISRTNKCAQLLLVELGNIRRPAFAVICKSVAATECDRFEDDSETTVYHIDVAHLGISGVSFARREIRLVTTIHVHPAAEHVQQPIVFITKRFLDPRLLLGGKHLNVCLSKLFRESSSQSQRQAVVMNVRKEMWVLREHMKNRNVDACISSITFNFVLVLG